METILNGILLCALVLVVSVLAILAVLLFVYFAIEIIKSIDDELHNRY